MSRRPRRWSDSLFYIFAEGDVTERVYFEESTFGSEPRPDRKFPIINKGHRGGQDSKSIMKWAEEEMRGRFKKGDIVWIVLDKDSNTSESLHELKKWCEEKGFRLAVSNPMFEYWLALHFQYIDYNVDRIFLEGFLTNNLARRYDKCECYNETLHLRIDKAVKNAEKVRNGINSEDYCDHNPFTNADMLVEDIRRYMGSGV